MVEISVHQNQSKLVRRANSNEVQTLIFGLFSSRKLLWSENNKCSKVDEFNKNYIKKSNRFFGEISVHQNVKANGIQQLDLSFESRLSSEFERVFSLFWSRKLLQNENDKCCKVDEFNQDHIQNIDRFFAKISVHQKVKENYVRQYSIRVCIWFVERSDVQLSFEPVFAGKLFPKQNNITVVITISLCRRQKREKIQIRRYFFIRGEFT